MNEPAKEFFEKAYELQMKGKLQEAVRLYKLSIKAYPTAEAHTFLGWTYSFMRRYPEAIEECRRAIEVDPTFGNPYNDIGVYLIELGKWDDAIPWFQRAIGAIRYEPRHFPHFNLSRVYVQRWEYDKAILHLEKALAIQPDYSSARRELNKLVARMN